MLKRSGLHVLTRHPWLTFAVALAGTLAVASIVYAATPRVRWDIVTQNFVAPLTTSPGGVASAAANDGSRITLTGSGIFFPSSFLPPTGGGNWTVRNPAGVVTGSGTYEVTDLLRWDAAPFTPGDPSIPRTDMISGGTRSTGLAVLRIRYSDGERGILVVSCTGVQAQPQNIFEGITASKGYVDYFNAVPPAGGVDANRTLFHVD